jgi:quercetin dioxygenase-like cupin family protein
MTKHSGQPGEAKAFQIFRGAEAPPLVITDYQGMTPVITDGLSRLREAGSYEGADARVLFEIPGFSLTYASFKSGYALPLHSHAADCLYYVTGGSLKLGTEHLHKGDGFFVPGNTPYSYVPGSDGVEVIEIRHHGCSDIKFTAKNPAYWDRAVKGMAEAAARWQNEKKPESID